MPRDGIGWHTPEQLSGTAVVRMIVVPVDLLPHVGGALGELHEPDNWYESGVTVDETIGAINDMIDLYYAPFAIGAINAFISLPLPPGWLKMGTDYLRSDYPELADIVPASWLSPSRIIIPSMAQTFLWGGQYNQASGAVVGSNTKQLSVANLPPHTHTYTPPAINPDVEGPGIPDVGATVLGPTSVTGSTGSQEPINIVPQSLTVYFGIFAGRVAP